MLLQKAKRKVRLTEYSHGSGCGCKITPAVLDAILKDSLTLPDDKLLIGNTHKDDAAVYALNDETAIISTTDFFMPIVDDAFTFGRIAATNAISDVFAMGGMPLMAISIFGWPVDKLPAEIGKQVVEGGRHACQEVGIQLAGGHSIDSPEPIFGLAVTGKVKIKHLKRNNTARAGNLLFLTKPLGIGILSTAQKKKIIALEHRKLAEQLMCQPNTLGMVLAEDSGVTAMTDVTGFGLGGHLLEMCEGAGLGARVDFAKLPILPAIKEYLAQGCSPGGAGRNFKSYGDKIANMSAEQQAIICDPQTSGGLLIAVAEASLNGFFAVCNKFDLKLESIGKFVSQDEQTKTIMLV